MDERRREQLRRSLQEELATQPGLSLDAGGRLAWLGERLIEYLDRWVAFCAASSVPLAKGIDSVLFDAVEIAASVVSSEVTRARRPDTEMKLWEDCVTALRAARSQPSDEAVDRLRLRLSDWCGGITETIGREGH